MIKSTKQKRLRPKLDRRNAIKNSDYQAADSPSSSSSFDDSSTTESRFFSLSTVSAGRSFRIEGVEGEFDRICRSLGLSIEDFAIPAAAWEASKVSSPSSQLRKCSFGDQVRTEDEELSDSLAGNVSGISDELTSVVESKEIDNAVIGESKIEARANDGSIHTDSITVYRIKGFRPPHLAPPPGVSQRAVDDGSSTWDILKAFGPADYKELDDFKQDDGITGRQMVGSLGYAARIVSESCSDTSNDENDCGNNGDSCNAMTEPIYCISPGDSFSRKIDSWQKGDFLGSGSFGTVYEGFTDDGFFFAVKEVSLLDQGSQGKQRILQLEHEISLLSQFRHENIVRYLGTEKDDSKLYIFLELVTKGSLQSLYQKYCLRDSQVSAYTRQILNGLNYLHRQNVVHRDIKCANILVDASGSVKLADFGLAKSTKLNDVKSCKGTAFWMAPEVVNQKSNGYGLAADIWSLGCTVLEMLTGHVPYSHLEAMQAIFRIGRGEPPPIPNSLSRDAQDFILKCLQVSPDDRPSAAELLEHPFIQKPPSTFPSPASHHYSGRVS